MTFAAAAVNLKRFQRRARCAASCCSAISIRQAELRDLLFHVQEHVLNLPQIARFLLDNGLQFLGFKLSPYVLQRYRRQFPEDSAMVDLDLWDRFEADNPRTFIGMYQFWIQKIAN